MKCPVCDCDLRHWKVNGAEIGSCWKCFGSFCPSDSMLVPVHLALPVRGALSCPACRTRMLRGTMFKRHLTLEKCPECAGVWFKAYEIDNLREYAGTEPIGAPEDGAAKPVRIEAESAPDDAFPRNTAAILAVVCVLYAFVIQRWDDPLAPYHRDLVWLLGVLRLMASPERSFQPGALSEERVFLWFAIAMLSAYVLKRILAWALPAEKRFPGTPPVGWGRHIHIPAKLHADEDYVACARAAKDFVAAGKKEVLLMKLSGHSLPTRWLEVYQDKPLRMLRTMTVTTAAVPFASYLLVGGRGVSAIPFLLLMGFAGMLLGFLLSCFLFAPILARMNRRARLKLISQWEGRRETR